MASAREMVSSFTGTKKNESQVRHEHRLLELGAECLVLRWTPLPGARSAPGAAPEAQVGGPGAGPGNPPRAPTCSVHAAFRSSIVLLVQATAFSGRELGETLNVCPLGFVVLSGTLTGSFADAR
ncbi:unnamed protein product [Prorocentrum cordatum]|uniref:Uncharacterized protein n=1 Tax=Prorocentrum cordatum TaxID=2364126 RepID=A0ABN9RYY9_9DINO|nr:unnamed protein product [Polarella glacialis]